MADPSTPIIPSPSLGDDPDEDDIAETITPEDAREAVAFFRAALLGAVLSIPFWALVLGIALVVFG